jgi:hypothetical protein
MSRRKALGRGVTHRHVPATAALIVALLVLIPARAATAQSGFGGRRGRALRLEGIVEPPSCDAAPCLGTLRLQVGQTVRPFGVTMAQAGNVSGMNNFRGFALQSQNLRLLGPASMLQPFLDAAPGSVARMWGQFQGLDFVIAQLKVEPAAATPSPAVGK